MKPVSAIQHMKDTSNYLKQLKTNQKVTVKQSQLKIEEEKEPYLFQNLGSDSKISFTNEFNASVLSNSSDNNHKENLTTDMNYVENLSIKAFKLLVYGDKIKFYDNKYLFKIRSQDGQREIYILKNPANGRFLFIAHKNKTQEHKSSTQKFNLDGKTAKLKIQKDQYHEGQAVKKIFIESNKEFNGNKSDLMNRLFILTQLNPKMKNYISSGIFTNGSKMLLPYITGNNLKERHCTKPPLAELIKLGEAIVEMQRNGFIACDGGHEDQYMHKAKEHTKRIDLDMDANHLIGISQDALQRLQIEALRDFIDIIKNLSHEKTSIPIHKSFKIHHGEIDYDKIYQRCVINGHDFASIIQ